MGQMWLSRGEVALLVVLLALFVAGAAAFLTKFPHWYVVYGFTSFVFLVLSAALAVMPRP